MRILIVDDNVDAAESLRMLLELEGHETAVAHDGVTALEEARQSPPDAILCDLDLPGDLDGFDVARRARGSDELATVTLVALTGYGRERVLNDVEAAGFDAHIMKPVELSAIQTTLDRARDRR